MTAAGVLRRSRDGVVALALAAAFAVGIAVVQPGLAARVHKVRQRDEVYPLPPPSQVRAMTLGYRSAAADLLWAKLIVEYGLHWQEKRRFENIEHYVDAIIAIEPDFSTLYTFVDTLLVFQPGGGTEEDARTARRYLERGTRERPYDAELWLRYGQFVVFLSPSFLKDPQEIERWRTEGAHAVAHAVELGIDTQRSLAASSILSKAGERRATIDHLQRAYFLADSQDAKEQILRKLQVLKPTQAEVHAEADMVVGVIDREWRERFGFLTRGQALLVGPYRSAAACAGPSSYERKGCPRDWHQAVEDRR